MKHFLNLGAGVQSSTMALMAAHGEIKPMPAAAAAPPPTATKNALRSIFDQPL